MLRILLFPLAVLLTLQSCSDQPAPRTFTDADYTKFTDSIGFAIRRGDTAFIISHFNFEAQQEKFVKAVRASVMAEEQARGLYKQEIANLLNSLSKRKDREFFRHLHTARKGDTATYYFRAYHDNKTEYLSVQTVPGPQYLLITDMMLFSTGLTFSEVLADFYRAIFVDNNKLLPGNDAMRINSSAIISQIGTIQQNLYDANYAYVLTAIKALPSEVQETVTIQQFEMNACLFTGDTLRAERLRKRTEGKSLVKNARSFMLYQYYFHMGKTDEALKCCDELDEIVKDPMIDLYRAAVYWRIPQYNRAEEYLQRAIKLTGNEHRQTTYAMLLKVYIDQSKTAEALALAAEMEEKASFSKNDLMFFFMNNREVATDPRVDKYFDKK
ncbi:MAG: hypothetical protein MUC87_16375 [Bacteroidia bacterium]|jgi:tetratricopeptide (TPR) repeat protein|nr:hypothetical protein [Bacteroidia bacterium]